MKYEGITLKNELKIDELYTIHYFEYASDFSFDGESHDFWELICVDKGEVYIQMGDKLITLKKGEIAFHQPNEFHAVEATGKSAPNLVVISFRCDSDAMDFFKKKILKVDALEKFLLANIIIETRHAFSCRLDNPYLTKMTRTASEIFGSEQLIKLYLEELLIHLIRRHLNLYSSPKFAAQALPLPTKSKSEIELFDRILRYMEIHITCKLTIEQICRDNMLSRSQLQKLFRAKTGYGIIEYFSKMKIDTAKELIRIGQMNFTQISEHLGYTSVHYFSRQFKKITRMTPSEYASSIKALSDTSHK